MNFLVPSIYTTIIYMQWKKLYLYHLKFSNKKLSINIKLKLEIFIIITLN